MPNIIDIIIHQPSAPYSAQMFLILDQMPDFKYERRRGLLVAKDGVFYSAYCYEQPTKYSQAFAGRHFDIPLIDGTVEKAVGQWWHTSARIDGVELIEPGMGTIDGLHRCYVFTGGISVEKALVDEWLSRNGPSSDYRKYERKPDHENRI